MKYFIFTDIDGTLFDHDTHSIPESALNAMIQAKENGHKIFLSSGRSYSDIDEIFKTLPIDGMVLGCGGQIIINNTQISTTTMPKEVVFELINFLKSNDIGFSLECVNNIYIYGYAYEMYRGWLKYMNNYIPFTDDELDEVLAKRNTYKLDKIKEEDYSNVLKLSFFAKEKEVVEEYLKTMPDCLFAYFDNMDPIIHSGEFYMKEVNKASGMDKVLEYYNHPLEYTIALGDSLNDKEMIEHASIGIAMENGQQTLKDVADFVTKKVNEDGFEFALKKYNLI